MEESAKQGRNLQSSQNLKTVSFSIWLLLVVSVVVAIVNQDAFFAKFFALELRPIATLSKRSGQTLVRSEGLARWRDLVDQQGIFDGDRLATSADTRSTLRFDSARSIMLGEDTQIQVSAIQQGDGERAFMITLFRGAIVAETDIACAGCPPLILLDPSGGTFNAVGGKKIALVKSPGKKAKAFDPKGQWPVTPRAERPSAVIGASFVKLESDLGDEVLEQRQTFYPAKPKAAALFKN